MISPSTFRDIVSGRRPGAAAALVRAGLRAASVPYGWAIGVRNRRFDRGGTEIYRPSVPVVSVGNLTVGGTGKTPMVEWLCRRARERGVRTAILSRGYGAAADGRNDEALELELALPDVPHLQNPERSASAVVAVDELGSQLLVLDDGFQHRQLARDFDLVLLDASEPFGFEYLLPGGTLREPVKGLQRAHAVALSRADMLDAAGRDAVRQRVAGINPHAAWCEVIHRPAALLAADGTRKEFAEYSDAFNPPPSQVEEGPRRRGDRGGSAVVRTRPEHEAVIGNPSPSPSLPGRGISRVAAFCGIGNPVGFRHTLTTLAGDIAAWREFPDHHAYERDDVESLAAWARETGAQLLVCTRKDLVKLRVNSIGGVPLRAVGVELAFLAGQAELEAALEPCLQKALAVAELE